MTRNDKNKVIENLVGKFNNYSHFYLTDISNLNAEDTSKLRRKCFEKEIELVVVKNTLLKKALEQSETNYNELYDTLKGSTSIMFTETSNVPGKLIKEFRIKSDRPVLKAAYAEESFYFGDDQIDLLSSIKSKEELIGDIILLLQSPVNNVVSSLQSGGNTLTGILKTLSEK